MSENIPTKQKCPRCAKNTIILDDELDELFCSDCGYVITEKDQKLELGITLHDEPNNKSTETSLSQTMINPINKDSSGKPISANLESFKRLKKIEKRNK